MFRRFLRPSSGARNCTYSFGYCQTILLLAGIMDEMELICHTSQQQYHIISYHLFTFRGSIQDYKIHMDMEIVVFA
jgi:hypothetical protein